jgi:exopolysaccharide production protein ExoQ
VTAPALSASDTNPAQAAAKARPKLGEADVFALAVRAVLMCAFFGNAIDYEAAHFVQDMKIGINFQAIIKAGFVVLAGLLGAIGWWRYGGVRVLQETSVGVLAVALGGIYFLAVLTSIDRSVSLVAAVAFNSYVLLMMTALIVCGPARIIQDGMFAILLHILLGWFFYLCIPEIGVYVESAGVQGEIRRMNGLAHPNVFGRLAGVYTVLALAKYSEGGRQAWVHALAAAFGFVSAAATLSRTALLATIFAAAFLNLYWLRHRLVLKAIFPILCLGLLGFVVIENEIGLERVIDRVLTGTSKTKDAEEITSVTGRTTIWEYSWKKIKERPILGYGAGTSPLILEDHSYQTHNIVLNPMMSFGFGGGIVMLAWLALNFYWSVNSSNPFVRGIGIFIIVSGLTENTILPTFPEATTLSWLAISFIPYVAFAIERAKQGEAK